VFAAIICYGLLATFFVLERALRRGAAAKSLDSTGTRFRGPPEKPQGRLILGYRPFGTVAGLRLRVSPRVLHHKCLLGEPSPEDAVSLTVGSCYGPDELSSFCFVVV
jgi:hypothetical protein